MSFKGTKIRKVRDARQMNHRNINELTFGRFFKTLRQAVFVINIYMGIWNNTGNRNATQILKRF